METPADKADKLSVRLRGPFGPAGLVGFYLTETNGPAVRSNGCVRKLAVLFWLAPLSAAAQTTPQGMMLQGLQKLGTAEKVTLETTGTEVRGTGVVDVKVTV